MREAELTKGDIMEQGIKTGKAEEQNGGEVGKSRLRRQVLGTS